MLLGSTRELLNLCDVALDVDPVYADKKIIVGDWLENTMFFENIIGDGVLNFNEDLCNKLLKMAEKNCSQFMVRAFNYRLPIMQVADYFPSVYDFSMKPKLIFASNEYSFYQWNFT